MMAKNLKCTKLEGEGDEEVKRCTALAAVAGGIMPVEIQDKA